MVPVSTPLYAEARASLQARIAESSQRDLSKAFVWWLLQNSEGRGEFASLAAHAAKWDGADLDFQTTASLGFAADAGLLSDSGLAALKKGLTRLAGRSPVVNGIPMAFTTDATGILGVALGTAVVADAEVSKCVAGWATQFLQASYLRDGAEDWQRCLFRSCRSQNRASIGIARSYFGRHCRCAHSASVSCAN
jgi:hypothetical protein